MFTCNLCPVILLKTCFVHCKMKMWIKTVQQVNFERVVFLKNAIPMKQLKKKSTRYQEESEIYTAV